MAQSIPELIQKKRDGLALTENEIEFIVKAVAQGAIQEAQIGALLMAMFLKGLNYRETADLTKAIVESGDVLEFDESWKSLLVDKHSTGGVGDKISLVLAPALAACGLKVPMVSGRGLAFTGGTLDKLESIRGFKVQLTLQEMKKCLEKVGCFIAGTTHSLAPADRVLYKFRDVTSTVDSIPLITSSILSKKAAESIQALVVDIKVGRGAMSKSLEEATKLAETMIQVAGELGLEMKAVLSEMDVPIGRFVGNSLEVVETIHCLKNIGSEDVTDLVATLGSVLLNLKGIAQNIDEGKTQILEVLKNGSALRKFKEMLVLQGVSGKDAAELCEGNMWSVLPKAEHVTLLPAKQTGVITDINAINIANACWALGAGRITSEAAVNHSVGVKLIKVVQQQIKEGEPWVEVHHKEVKLNSTIENLIQDSLGVRPVCEFSDKSRVIRIL